MQTIQAPAKINLTLEVLGKRPDGFHEIRSVLQTVNLCDSISFNSGRGIVFTCDMLGWSAEKSLVSRAAGLLQEFTGCSRGAKIDVKKRIPLASGLGGDSSDAAAMLCGLNELWELNLTTDKLLELAVELGSDVSFFIFGGTVLAEGRGEKLTVLPPLSHMWVLLVLPGVPVPPEKTKEMYKILKFNHYTDGHITENLVKDLKTDNNFKTSILFNTFENVAFDRFPGLKVVKEHLMKLGAPHVHLAGSGPALFTIFKDRNKAKDLYSRCQGQGMEVYLVDALKGYEKP